MSDQPQHPGDLSDLGFDLTPHREALVSFARLNLDPASIQPTLRARDLVFVRLPTTRFTIGLTGDPARQVAAEAARGSVGFEVLCQAETTEAAGHLRAEIERYFLRHYPGRTVSWTANPDTAADVFVYIVCRPADA